MCAVPRGYDLTQFRVPAVRHLAWVCHAPQLSSGAVEPGGASRVDIAGQLPSDTLARLQRWDAQPGDGPAVLTQAPHPRLGLYFEQLYGCLMAEILGWEVLARNLQISRAGKTLGELDFVLRNPRTRAMEHHEIAVKFYLGYQAPETGAVRWYGPHARDRLDLKTRHLLEHQSRLTRFAETGAALAAHGIGQPRTSGIFIPGYLFYPLGPALPPPPQVPDDHQRGYWMYLEDAQKFNTENWVALQKPHWLGPWCQPQSAGIPDPRAALENIRSTGTPGLFAKLRRHDQTGLWTEAERFFVVPAHWPGASANK